MQRLSNRTTTKLIRALKDRALNGIPTEAKNLGYTVRVRGLDPLTGAAESHRLPAVELWHGSFSHAVRFEVIDARWPTSQWNLLQAALSQCLKLKLGPD
ncbi:hypothetical protein GCM10009672_22550 [Nesterenkonia lutea]